MKQKLFWLKLTGTAICLHIVLILISILEVVIYSYLIVPGKSEEFYSAHAHDSGPWVSAIFGSLFIFLLVKWYIKRFSLQQLTYAIGLPVIYLIIDLIMIFALGYKFDEVISPVTFAFIPKIIAALLAYFVYSKSKSQMAQGQ